MRKIDLEIESDLRGTLLEVMMIWSEVWSEFLVVYLLGSLLIACAGIWFISWREGPVVSAQVIIEGMIYLDEARKIILSENLQILTTSGKICGNFDVERESESQVWGRWVFLVQGRRRRIEKLPHWNGDMVVSVKIENPNHSSYAS